MWEISVLEGTCLYVLSSVERGGGRYLKLEREGRGEALTGMLENPERSGTERNRK